MSTIRAVASIPSLALDIDRAAGAEAAALAVRRAVFWGMIAGKLLSGWGVGWDIQWHVRIGRDSFWIAPHLMTYAGVTLVVLLSFGILARETWQGPAGARTLRILGLRGTRGFHAAAWGIAVTVAAAPIDDLWHRLFGLDVTIWSPPHLLGFLGGALNAIGLLLVATEVYPAGGWARLAALAVAGADLYGGLRFTLQPAMLVAYHHGGVRFHSYAMLAALILPLGLIAPARLSGFRAAPLLVMGVGLLFGLVGEQIAQTGFALLQPVPALDQAIAQDPTSPIATAAAIARKNGATRPPWFMRFLPLVTVLGMVLTDPRRRPVLATVAFAVSLFAVTGWSLAARPAYAPMVPGAGETLLALGLTVAAAVAGGAAARRLAERLATAGPVARSG